jgi:hypothetical protein
MIQSVSSISTLESRKKISFGASLAFAFLTILLAGLGKGLKLDAFNDAAIATAVVTLAAFAVGMVYREKEKKRRLFILEGIFDTHQKFRQRNIISTNNMIRNFSDMEEGFFQIATELDAKKEMQRKRALDEMNREPIKNNWVYAERLKNKALESGIGNCHELASLAFWDLKKYFQNKVKVDLYSILGGDHLFIVIGREPNSNPNDPTTWGKNAVVYDPWISSFHQPTFFPVEELTQKLRCVLLVENDKQATLREFNPDSDTLMLETTNLYSSQEFEREVAGSALPLIDLKKAISLGDHDAILRESHQLMKQFQNKKFDELTQSEQAVSQLASQMAHLSSF